MGSFGKNTLLAVPLTGLQIFAGADFQRTLSTHNGRFIRHSSLIRQFFAMIPQCETDARWKCYLISVNAPAGAKRNGQI
jgi:hypothetical protein